jgi:hypothetical protein
MGDLIDSAIRLSRHEAMILGMDVQPRRLPLVHRGDTTSLRFGVRATVRSAARTAPGLRSIPHRGASSRLSALERAHCFPRAEVNAKKVTPGKALLIAQRIGIALATLNWAR